MNKINKSQIFEYYDVHLSIHLFILSNKISKYYEIKCNISLLKSEMRLATCCGHAVLRICTMYLGKVVGDKVE